MIRVIFNEKIYEANECGNFELHKWACQILLASGYYSTLDTLKNLGIFLKVKDDCLYIDYVQNGVGQKRKIDGLPLILFTGVIELGKRKQHWKSLGESGLEVDEILFVKDGNISWDEDPERWKNVCRDLFGMEMFSVEQVRNILKIKGYNCEVKKVVLYSDD